MSDRTEADAPPFRARLAGRVRAGLQRVRVGLVLAVQSGLAAALAWAVAHDMVGRSTPFFAPIAAVITLASSVGQRLRRTAEVVIGVAIGIGVGDAIIVLIGRGPWQIGLVVLLAVLIATGLGGGAPLVVQSASSAVLVATLTSSSGQPWSRFFDALIGGGVGLTVMTVLLPLNPLTVVRRATEPALQALVDGLRQVADALASSDPDRATEALAKLRDAERTFAAFESAVVAARENVAFAPARWRSRGALAQYVEGAQHVTYALRNVRVLIRRVTATTGDGETVPPVLPGAIRLLADAVALLKYEWAKGAEPVAARERALRAVTEAMRAYDDGVGFSGGVVVAQIRSTAIDLLRATGVESAESVRMVRRATGWHGRPRTSRGPRGRPIGRG